MKPKLSSKRERPHEKELQLLLKKSSAERTRRGLRTRLSTSANSNNLDDTSFSRLNTKRNKSKHFLNQMEFEHEARKFSKIAFRDPSAISSLHLNVHDISESKMRRKRTRVVTPSLTDTYDENNNKSLQRSRKLTEPTSFNRLLTNEDDKNKNVELREDIETESYFIPLSDKSKPLKNLQEEIRPETHINRNVSETKLYQIKELGRIDLSKLNRFVWILKLISILLVISGVMLLIFIIGFSMFSAAVDFLRQYFLQNKMTFMFVLAGILYPPIIAIYSQFALSNLVQMRPYFLRVPFTLVFPIGLLSCSLQYVNTITKSADEYLVKRISSYKISSESQNVLDGLHKMLSCCGIRSKEDWKPFLNSSGSSRFPTSCCIQTQPGCPDFALPEEIYSNGCLNGIISLNEGLGAFIVIIAILQLSLLIASILFTMRLFHLIRNEMEDARSNCKIIMGKCYSICDTVNYDEQQELALTEQQQFQQQINRI